MSGKHSYLIRYLLWFADMVMIVVSFVLATYLRFFNFRDMEDKALHFYVCIVFLLVGTIYTYMRDRTPEFLHRTFWQEGTVVLEYEFALVVGTMVLNYALSLSDTFSRLVMGYFAIINPILTLFVHELIRFLLAAHWRNGDTAIKLLVLTEKEALPTVIRRLRSTLDVNYEIVGAACLDEDLQGEKEQNVPIIAGRDGILSCATRMPLDEIFLYTPTISPRELADTVDGFLEMGVTVHYCIEPMLKDTQQIGNLGSFPVTTSGKGTGRHRAMYLKRGMDIVGGAVGCILTLIMLPFVAIAIKLDSPGPVFFSQIRIGRGGRRFRIYKFRTMVVDAEAQKAALEAQNEMNGPMFKMKDDPRVTRVGRFLRKTSLDEFPQFWNILRGDMSLVGTRPPTEAEFETYNEHYRRRISMTPGLTGLWQVSGRSAIEDFDEVVRLDLQYIDHWSIALDLRILIKTVWVVLFRKGAR
ncbi:MAG: sugar transferase [Butyrivibrio sp.]|nr:sugar transferase [Butyrivibrio sp.]